MVVVGRLTEEPRSPPATSLLMMLLKNREVASQNGQVRTGRSEQVGQNRQVRTGRSEKRGQNRQVRTDRSE